MTNRKSRGVKVGDPLPDLVLPDQNGTMVQLRGWVGRSALVLFFYPKDGSPVCTREVCHFGERHDEFQGLNAEVIGISSDGPESHARFSGQHDLPFTLLSDTDGQARERFGTGSTLGFVPGRVTYVADRQGVVRHIYRSQLRARKHVEKALSALNDDAE